MRGERARSIGFTMHRFLTIPSLLLIAQPLPSQPTTGTPLDQLAVADLKKMVETANRNAPTPAIAPAEAGLRRCETTDAKEALWFAKALARDLTTLSDYPRARAYADRALSLATSLGLPAERVTSGLLKASALMGARDYTSAMALLARDILPTAQADADQHPDDIEAKKRLARVHRVRGNLSSNLSRFPDAVEGHTQALRIYDRIGDHRGQALAHDALSSTYLAMGKPQEAEQAASTAVKLSANLDDESLRAGFILSLANAYGALDNPDRQTEELAKARALAAKVQDDYTVLTCDVNLADASLRKKDYQATLRYATEAVTLSIAAKDEASTAISRINQGIALNRLGRFKDGLAAIREGREYFLKLGDSASELPEITKIMAEESAFAGDYKQAYEFHLEFKRLTDLLTKSEDQKRIAEALASYENDKKELKITALLHEQRAQKALRNLWVALTGLGLVVVGILALGRKRLRSANQALEEMSLRDPLTGLANRRYLTTRIHEDLAQINRYHRNNSLSTADPARMAGNIDVLFVMIDLDHFKAVNDHHGHGAGDAVLRQFAAVLTSTMRDSDTVVRWGGEEFFVVAKNAARADAHIVVERIRSAVANHPFALDNGHTIHKTCSIGYAIYPFAPGVPGGITWERVAEIADQCLYAAKRSGRDRWVGVQATESPDRSALAEALNDEISVAELVAKGLLAAKTSDNQAIVW